MNLKNIYRIKLPGLLYKTFIYMYNKKQAIGINIFKLTMDQFNIITSANSELELLIKESLLIKTHKPTLNNMESLNLKII